MKNRMMPHHPSRLSAWLLVGLLCFLFSGGRTSAAPLRLATTTSTDNSGLLAALLPAYESQTGDTVKVIAVGTGKALKLGEDGNVDVVLVHAPMAEEAFVAAGFGVNRRSVMYNDFVLVGPAEDPAQVRGLTQAPQALQQLKEAGALFVSRGDDSGTHKKERALWKLAGGQPTTANYREAGQGMGAVLIMSSELGAYTLTDRGTWLAFRDKLALQVLVAGDERLFNPYGIIAVNPARYPEINYQGAMRLIAWLTSVEGQHRIRDFTVQGEPLFIPTAVQD